MPREGGHFFIVLVMGMFVVPQLMQYLPNFDPLMLIMAVFAILAAVQHLGFSQENAASETTAKGTSQRAKQESQRREDQGHKNSENSAEGLLKNAEQALEQNNYERVQELAQKLIDMDPEKPRPWELLVTALKWDGKRKEAAASAKKALELYEVKSKVLKGMMRELNGGCDIAAAATLAQENSKKGDDFLAKRQYDLGLDCYNRCIDALTQDGSEKVQEDSQDLYLSATRNRAACAQQLQDWGTCRRDATVLLESDPNDQQALLQRAASNEALEKFSAALEDARKLLSLDPKSVAANRMVHNCQKAINS